MLCYNKHIASSAVELQPAQGSALMLFLAFQDGRPDSK